MNKDSAVAQANLNRIDQYTPQGSITYQQNGTNSDGTPKYAQTQQYSSDEQAKYDQANQIALSLGGLAGDNISRVQGVQQNPFSFDGMTPLRTSIGTSGPALQGTLDYSKLSKLPGMDDFSADGQRVASSVYNQATSRLDPQFQQSDSDMRAKLAAQGISENSDAYRREVDNFTRGKTDAYNQANYSAIQAGGNEQSRLFGLALAGRQQGQGEADAQGAFNNQARAQGYNENSAELAANNQGRQQQIDEASYLRNLPLNEIAALLGTGGGVNNPNFQPVSQVGVAAPDYQGAVYQNYNAANQQYQQQQANRSAGLGSIFGALGTAATMFSDARMKHGIKRVGTLPSGLPTYSFKYRGSKVTHFGVMAQEALKIIPQAVGKMRDGMMYVDYGKVYA